MLLYTLRCLFDFPNSLQPGRNHSFFTNMPLRVHSFVFGCTLSIQFYMLYCYILTGVREIPVQGLWEKPYNLLKLKWWIHPLK